jgi:transcription elongation factor GreA
VDKIKAARELGDLSENFEYHSAKNEQGFIESRINELEAIVKNARLIEPVQTGKVEVGSTVRFQEGDGPHETYRIVGTSEADPTQGRVSYESAIGKAMLGKKVGQTVEVATPGGSYEVTILAID